VSTTTTTTQISIHPAGDDPSGEKAIIVRLGEGGRYLSISKCSDAIFIGADELPLLVAACERLLRKPRRSGRDCQQWHRRHAATSRPGSPEWFQEVDG
jgi:hypothetical protein